MALAAPLVLVSAIAAAGLQPAGQDCDVTVGFGSFATGIDRAAASRVERLVEQAPFETQVSRATIGPEGEYAICVRTRSRVAAARLFDSLRAALCGPVGAPVFVQGPQGSFRAPLRRQSAPKSAPKKSAPKKSAPKK